MVLHPGDEDATREDVPGTGTGAGGDAPRAPGDRDTRRDAESLFGRTFASHPAPFGVARIPDGRLVAVNDSFLRFFGYGRDEVLERTALELGMHADPARRERLLADLQRAGRLAGAELEVRTRSGARRLVHVSAQVVPDADGPCAAFVLHDVTEMRATQQELRRVHDELRAQEAARLRLLAAVAHDIAHPITPVRLQLHALGRSMAGLGEEFERPLRMIVRNVGYLSHLVDDLQQLALIETGRITLKRQHVDLRRLVHDAVETVAPAYDDRTIAFRVEAPRALPVHADPQRLAQVLFNLLSNAAKHSRDGSEVEVRGRDEDTSVAVSVRDTGRGLTEDELKDLFQPFRRLGPKDSETRGMGLGLFITKHLVEAHDGRLWASSAGPGRGAVFSFEIPRDRGLPSSAAGAAPARSPRRGPHSPGGDAP